MFVAAAFAAVRTMDSVVGLEPALAVGVTHSVKTGIVQSIVAGIGATICALLGIRPRSSMIARRRLGSYVEDDDE